MVEVDCDEERKLWTTKEVAEGLGLSTKTILGFYNQNRSLFRGLVIVSPTETIKGKRNGYSWTEEAIKILGMSIENTHYEKWKENIINEVKEKGYVITSSASSLDLIKQQSMQIIAIVDQMQEMRSDIRQLQDKTKNVFVTPQTRRLLRDDVHRIALQYFGGKHWKVWTPIKQKYHVNRYEELTEENAKKELELLKKKYPPINQNQLSYIK